ncbi:MAG: tail tape measure protein [Pacificimonas sp.]|jgi:hypothetical protein|nr:tail tape measure protein [Pacificimonas sp.]
MDDELETLVVKVRADTRDFAKGVEEMRGLVEGPLTTGMDRAARGMETALGRFIRTGKFGFEDLRRTALSVLADIAQGQLRGVLRGGSGGGLLGGLIGGLVGLPGRATGGPVSPGQAYMVGERGPELFVPTASGRVEMGAGLAQARGPVTVNINVASSAAKPEMMRRSARQVARAVQRSLGEAH